MLKENDCFTLFNGIIKGDFCTAFSVVRYICLVVVDYTEAAVVYHFVVAFNVGGFACTCVINPSSVFVKAALNSLVSFMILLPKKQQVRCMHSLTITMSP